MIKGEVKGFSYEIDEAVLDDIEFLELLGEADENIMLIPKVATAFLGEEQRKALYDHLRGENGRVKTSDVSAVILEMINSIPKDGKN